MSLLRGHLGPGAVALLLAALSLALVSAVVAPPHVHADDGLYNESHVLSTLATLHGEAPAADPGPRTYLPPVRPLALPSARSTLPLPVGADGDSRAPPLA